MSTTKRTVEEVFYYYDSQHFDIDEDGIILMSRSEFESILNQCRDPSESPDEWQSFGDIKFIFDEDSQKFEIEYPCRFMSEVQGSIYESYLKELRECQL